MANQLKSAWATCSKYMLVMEVDPIDGRKFKHRIFIDVCDQERLSSGAIMDLELAEAKKLGVKPNDIVTINIVKLP